MSRPSTPRGPRPLLRAAAAILCLGAAGAPTVGRSAPDAAPAPPGNLPFFYDLYTFRGDAGSTDVVAAFAVPAGRLRAEKADPGVRYRFDVSLVLADTALRAVSRTDDSVFVALRRPLDGDHLLYTQIQVRTAPSRNTVQRVIMSEATRPGVGQLYHTPYPVPDYGGTHLMLSDIALGQPSTSRHGWRRGPVTLALLPGSQFPASAFEVYYEIYNLPDGHPYTTTVEVEPIRDGAPDPVGLRFSGTAEPRPDGTVAELRHVDAALARGAYRLTVTITDQETGESARRSRRFHVRGPGAGTTLVVAHPWRVRSTGHP